MGTGHSFTNSVKSFNFQSIIFFNDINHIITKENHVIKLFIKDVFFKLNLILKIEGWF